MTTKLSPEEAEKLEGKFVPALKNPAVALCSEAWEKTLRLTLEKTRSMYTAKRASASLYRMAMPPLSGYQNICDFIACAGYGILLGAIKPDVGTKLLYAAQVALATLPKEAKIQALAAAQPASKKTTPPPFLLQPQQTKRIKSKKPLKTPQITEIPTVAGQGSSATL